MLDLIALQNKYNFWMKPKCTWLKVSSATHLSPSKQLTLLGVPLFPLNISIIEIISFKSIIKIKKRLNWKEYNWG